MNELQSSTPGYSSGTSTAANTPVANTPGLEGRRDLLSELQLPDPHASKKELENFIRTKLSKDPSCPDLENPDIINALTWALKTFVNVADQYSY
eukprot:UN11355